MIRLNDERLQEFNQLIDDMSNAAIDHQMKDSDNPTDKPGVAVNRVVWAIRMTNGYFAFNDRVFGFLFRAIKDEVDRKLEHRKRAK